ncbi:MAG: glycosyltransferase [Kiritimatiellae bacterium]|nr:glycosyltransferase [Kiritimatiellia bacterium]
MEIRSDRPAEKEDRPRGGPILIAARNLDHPEARLFAELARKGWRMEAVLHPERRHAAWLEEAGIPIHELDLGPRRLPGAVRAELAEILQRGKFRIVHSLHNSALRGVWKTIPRGMDAPRWIAYRGAMNLTWSSLWFYRRIPVDAVVCVCEAVRAHLLGRGLPDRMLRGIYKGHDPAWYPASSRALLREFNIPPGAVVFGSAASWRPSKGGALWLEALQRVPPDVPIVALAIGDLRDRQMERLARDPRWRDRIRLAGPRPDAAALMGACDGMVMPTLEREGLCKAVIEAAIQGVPAIVSDAGGMPEIIRDGMEGLVVPRGQAAALASAMEHMARDADFRAACGRRARERILSAFHLRQTVAAYDNLYTELLSPRS